MRNISSTASPFATDAEQIAAYCGAVLLTFENYLKVGALGLQPSVINRALESIGFATRDLYQLDKSEPSRSSSLWLTPELLVVLTDQIRPHWMLPVEIQPLGNCCIPAAPLRVLEVDV
jgi:hypothetical protein